MRRDNIEAALQTNLTVLNANIAEAERVVARRLLEQAHEVIDEAEEEYYDPDDEDGDEQDTSYGETHVELGGVSYRLGIDSQGLWVESAWLTFALFSEGRLCKCEWSAVLTSPQPLEKGEGPLCL